MPVVGERKQKTIGSSLNDQSMLDQAKAFCNLNKALMMEEGVNLLNGDNAVKAVSIPQTDEAIRSYWNEDMDMVLGEDLEHGVISQANYNDYLEMHQEMYENDKEGILEHCSLVSVNPVMGITFPLHKNLLIDTIFDKNVIPKTVARTPYITETMETRCFKDPQGNKIDMWLEQNKIHGMMKAARNFKHYLMDLPERKTTDILEKVFHLDKRYESLAVDTCIDGIYVEDYFAKQGETYIDADDKEVVAASDGVVTAIIPIKRIEFTPSYGEIDRIISSEVVINYPAGPSGDIKELKTTFYGSVKDNMFELISLDPAVNKIRMEFRVDISTATTDSCSVSWETTTSFIQIDDGTPLHVQVSPQELKDIAALYNEDQVAKYMELLKLGMSNWKDGDIHEKLDESFKNLPKTQMFSETFDFVPRQDYAASVIQYRKEHFMDRLDMYVETLMQYLNDPNMTVSIIGRPTLIQRVTPNDFTYNAPTNIGPVNTEYRRTVVSNANNRVYQFVQTDKMRNNNNLIVLLTPRNTNRIIYKLYDYQFLVTNEIRNIKNPALPNIYTFERYKFYEYQPLQGRLRILDPTGQREYQANPDPIGVNKLYDDTANLPEGVRP